MAVVSDRKVVKAVGTDISYYADVVSATDYYAFGMVMADRSWNTEGYRYGFNGKENDNEVKGTGNQQDYGMRIYDPRLGRFLSVDPLFRDYPSWSPYPFAMNRPIDGVDLDGLEFADAKTGKPLGPLSQDGIKAYNNEGLTILGPGGQVYRPTLTLTNESAVKVTVRQSTEKFKEYTGRDPKTGERTFIMKEVTITNYSIQEGSSTINVVHFKTDFDVDYDGVDGKKIDPDESGDNHSGFHCHKDCDWDLNAVKDRYIAVPDRFITDKKYNIKYGDVGFVRYKGKWASVTVGDAGGQKIGEGSAGVFFYLNLVNKDGKPTGIDGEDVDEFIIQNTSEGKNVYPTNYKDKTKMDKYQSLIEKAEKQVNSNKNKGS